MENFYKGENFNNFLEENLSKESIISTSDIISFKEMAIKINDFLNRLSIFNKVENLRKEFNLYSEEESFKYLSTSLDDEKISLGYTLEDKTVRYEMLHIDKTINTTFKTFDFSLVDQRKIEEVFRCISMYYETFKNKDESSISEQGVARVPIGNTDINLISSINYYSKKAWIYSNLAINGQGFPGSVHCDENFFELFRLKANEIDEKTPVEINKLPIGYQRVLKGKIN